MLLNVAGIDSVLARSALPAVGVVADARGPVYEGAAGGIGVDSVFRIYSMTKPVTTAAVLQLVGKGVVGLDEPACKYVPALANSGVLETGSGGARLRPPASAVTVRQLLNHTSGFVYEIWNERLRDYLALGGAGRLSAPGDEFLLAPLLFDPGTRWEYGTGIDVAAKVVESASGLGLEEYFRRNLFEPLSMSETGYSLDAERAGRAVAVLERAAAGALVHCPRMSGTRPFWPRGGAGLYSTAGDYVKFLQVFLNGGCSASGRILSRDAVAMMTVNQIGDFWAARVPTAQPAISADLEIVPGARGKFSFGFFINAQPVAGGRAAGSLAWAGLLNTFFWIDPARGICAVLLMQVKPFLDPDAAALLQAFEQAVYASL